VEQLPIWFLLLSLALPRVSLLGGYFIADIPLITSLSGWVPPTIGVLVPRALVLLLIFQDLGMSPWLLVHAVAMAFVYLAAGSASS
jgi:hypothetical protein